MLRALYSFLSNTRFLLKQKYPSQKKCIVFLTYIKLSIQAFVRGKTSPCLISSRICGFTVYAFDYHTLSFLFQEIFVRGEYMFHSGVSSPVIYDCGSNIGMSVLFFKWLYPESVIHAFEPDPDTFTVLEKNIQANTLSSVILHRTALGDTTGTISFYRNAAARGSLKASVLKERSGGNAIEVPLSPLSSFITGPVDFLKIDTEGAEGSILKELVEKNSFPQVKEMILEYHHNISENSVSLSAILSYIEKSGFKYQIDSPFSPLSRKNRFQDVMLYCYRNM